MLTAIAIDEDRIANHFTKATQLMITDERQRILARITNPALNASCDGKKAMVAALHEAGVTRVVVRNIGQRMLGQLLDSGIAVYQAMTGRLPQDGHIDESLLTALTSAEQGRPSPNYLARHADGDGCGECGHEHQQEAGLDHDSGHQCQKPAGCGNGHGGCCRRAVK